MKKIFSTFAFIILASIAKADIDGVVFGQSCAVSVSDGRTGGGGSHDPSANISSSLDLASGDDGATSIASLSTSGSATPSTLDFTGSFRAETDNSRGNGGAYENSSCQFYFRTDEPCYFTCTGTFTAMSGNNSRAYGYVRIVDYTRGQLSSFGEGDFSGLGQQPDHSGGFTAILPPGYYQILTATDCSGKNTLYGTNGSATASVTFSVSTIPKNPPPVTFTPPKNGEADPKLCTDTRVGLSYQLQGSDDLTNWSNIGSPQAGTGSKKCFSVPNDPTKPKARFFYRIIISFSGTSSSKVNTTRPNHALQRTAHGGPRFSVSHVHRAMSRR